MNATPHDPEAPFEPRSEPTSLHDGPRGVVARVVDPDGTPLVVKRLTTASVEEAATVAVRMLAVASTDHPSVGQVRSVRIDDVVLEVVRDDLPNSALDWLETAPTWGEVVRRWGEILRALAAIHAAGRVHGAVRLDNARWRDEGPTQLVDGGWPGVKVPEGRVGPAGDLWAAGAWMWRAVTGEAVAVGKPLPRFSARFDVPNGLPTLLANLLHADPLERYDLAADVLTELASLGETAAATGREARPGPLAPAEAMTGPVAWRRPAPAALPATPPSLPAAWRHTEPPFVGRDDALQALWQAAGDAASGPAVVLLIGAAGMGRTRVARRLVTALALGGWAETQWVSYEDDPVRDGFLGAVSAAYAGLPDDAPAATEAIARRLARDRGVIIEDAKEEAAALRRMIGPRDEEEPQRVGVARAELVRRLEVTSWRGRSLLVIDDAAAPGAEGLQLAAVLQRSTLRTLVLVTLDLDDLDTPDVRAAVAKLEAGGARKVMLRPLTSAESHAMLVGGPDQASAQAVASIASAAAGCPEVARQMLLALGDVGVRTPSGELDWPPGAPPLEGDWLSPHLERLAARSGAPRRFKDALHLCALAGASVPAVMAHQFLGPAHVAAAAMSGLWGAQELDAGGSEGHWSLSPLVREAAAHAAAARPDVAYLHRRLAEGYARLPHGRCLRAAGEHSLMAGERDVGVERLGRVAEMAWRAGAAGAGRELAALTASESPPTVAWLWAAREAPGDAEVLAAAASHLERPAHRAEVQVLQGHLALRAGDADRAEALFKAAVDGANKAGHATLESGGLAGRAWVAHLRRNFSGADVHFTRAVNRLAAADAPRAMAEVMMGQAFVACRTGRFREAAEIYDEAADAFREADDLVGSGRARLGLARVRRQQLDLDAAMRWVEVVATTAVRQADPSLSRSALLVRAEVLRQEGTPERDTAAAEAYRGFLAFGPIAEDVEGAVLAELGLAQLALTASDAHEAYERANRAAAHLEALPQHWLWARYRLVVAALLADRGDHMQTWQWLWSASELGLGDTVDRDTAALVGKICNVGKMQGWGNVIRVAGSLAVEQLERLGESDEAQRVQQDLTGIILK